MNVLVCVVVRDSVMETSCGWVWYGGDGCIVLFWSIEEFEGWNGLLVLVLGLEPPT